MARIPLAAARHPVRSLVLGYLLAFAVPWTVWGTLIAEQRGMLTWHIPQALAFWIGPPLACIVGAVAGGGRDPCPGRPRRGRPPSPRRQTSCPSARCRCRCPHGAGRQLLGPLALSLRGPLEHLLRRRLGA